MKCLLLFCLCLCNGPVDGFLSRRSTSQKISLRLTATQTIHAPPLLPVEGGTPSDDAASSLEIVYTTDPSVMDKWLQAHAREEGTVLGFDTESIPRAPWLSYGRRPVNEKEGPATLQLSTVDSCLVVHLAHCPQHLPALQETLQDVSIIKAGVGIDDDALELYRSSFALETVRRFDLSCVLEGSSPQKRMGLRPLLAKTVGLDLPKSKKLSMSNWGAKSLTQRQLTYAAYDAWASAKIVQALGHHQLDWAHVFLTHQLLERPLKELDVRARTRKAAKTEWKQLREQEGEWTADERAEHDRLWQVMMDMRPDPPLMLNISMVE